MKLGLHRLEQYLCNVVEQHYENDWSPVYCKASLALQSLLLGDPYHRFDEYITEKKTGKKFFGGYTTVADSFRPREPKELYRKLILAIETCPYKVELLTHPNTWLRKLAEQTLKKNV